MLYLPSTRFTERSLYRAHALSSSRFIKRMLYPAHAFSRTYAFWSYDFETENLLWMTHIFRSSVPAKIHIYSRRDQPKMKIEIKSEMMSNNDSYSVKSQVSKFAAPHKLLRGLRRNKIGKALSWSKAGNCGSFSTFTMRILTLVVLLLLGNRYCKKKVRPFST